MHLRSRNALVCGASQGIGAATAILLAAQGASVTLLARDADRLHALAGKLDRSAGQQHQVLAVDMSDTEALGRAVEGHLAAHGPVHVLVNNTGGPPPGPAHEASVQAYEQAFRLHLLAYQTLVLAVVPGMKGAGGGRIIM
jgi:3-oxoacyl-[acyl-carrier protein] reductase